MPGKGMAGTCLSATLFLVFPAVLFIGVGPAQAQQPSLPAPQATAAESLPVPDYHGVNNYLRRGNPARALAVLQEHASEHENDADYFNVTALVAQQAGDYPAAVLAFERVVLMQPDNAGAWLDLAISTFRTGDLARSTAYFDYIDSHFRPPPALRAIISNYREQIAANRQVRPWKFQFDAGIGSDSNANSGLHVSSLPLTFDTQRVELAIDPSFQARQDRFLEAGAKASYRQQFGTNTIELTAGLRQRSYFNEHDFSTLSGNAGAAFTRPMALGDVTAGVHIEHFSLGGKALVRDMRALAQLERPYAGCRIGFGGEAEIRRYNTASQLDGNLLWGQTGIACDANFRRIPLQFALIARLGEDTPLGSRPGGKTRNRELIGQITAPLAWGATLNFSATIARAGDTEGYSPLLENNAVRTITRENGRMALSLPGQGGWNYHFVLERSVISSNLILFQQSGTTFTAGISCGF
jgi:hypothetical protein